MLPLTPSQHDALAHMETLEPYAPPPPRVLRMDKALLYAVLAFVPVVGLALALLAIGGAK